MKDAETAGLKTSKKDIIDLIHRRANAKVETLDKEAYKIENDTTDLANAFSKQETIKINNLIKKNKLSFMLFSVDENRWYNRIILPKDTFISHDGKTIHKSFIAKYKKIKTEIKEVKKTKDQLIDQITLYGVSPEIVKMIEKAFK